MSYICSPAPAKSLILVVTFKHEPEGEPVYPHPFTPLASFIPAKRTLFHPCCSSHHAACMQALEREISKCTALLHTQMKKIFVELNIIQRFVAQSV
jgi:hypothetical protein